MSNTHYFPTTTQFARTRLIATLCTQNIACLVADLNCYWVEEPTAGRQAGQQTACGRRRTFNCKQLQPTAKIDLLSCYYIIWTYCHVTT